VRLLGLKKHASMLVFKGDVFIMVERPRVLYFKKNYLYCTPGDHYFVEVIPRMLKQDGVNSITFSDCQSTLLGDAIVNS